MLIKQQLMAMHLRNKAAVYASSAREIKIDLTTIAEGSLRVSSSMDCS